MKEQGAERRREAKKGRAQSAAGSGERQGAERQGVWRSRKGYDSCKAQPAVKGGAEMRVK